ncbi:MAG: hypothetical protein ACTSP4_00695 [Candidatus Hodarchaeales archaeon]
MSNYKEDLVKAKKLGISFDTPMPKKETLAKALVDYKEELSVQPNVDKVSIPSKKEEIKDIYRQGKHFSKNKYKYKIGKEFGENEIIEKLLGNIGINGVVFDKNSLAFTMYDNSRKYVHNTIDIGVVKREYDRLKYFIKIKNGRVYSQSKVV